MNSASARASSVLPTPVGPRKRKLPIGRSGSLSPARERRRALETAATASSWPTTRAGLRLLGLLELALQLGDLPVAQLRGELEVGLALGALELAVGLLEALLDGRDLVDLVLLGLPLGLHGRAALAQVAELALDRLAALDARLVGLVGQRGELDLELQDAAIDLVDLGRQRVDLDAQLGGGLVDEVDGLVGQEAVGDVAIA